MALAVRWLLLGLGVFFASCVVAVGGASASTPAFTEDWETGGGGWTMVDTSGTVDPSDPRWQVLDHPETIGVASPGINPNLVTLPDSGQLPSANDGTHVAWFGDSSSGTFCGTDWASVAANQGASKNGCTSREPFSGTLTSPTFSLVGASSAVLHFSSWFEIEGVNAISFDLMQVQYSADGGASWSSPLALNPPNNPAGGADTTYSNNGPATSPSWEPYLVDLSPAAGSSQVQIRFTFNTNDALYNGFRGWLVDSISVDTPYDVPAPAISTVDTCNGTQDSPVTVIHGSNFVEGSTVLIDGTAPADGSNTLSSSRMEISQLSAGTHSIQVQSPNGTSSNTINVRAGNCQVPPGCPALPPTTPLAAPSAPPALPLHTRGRFILDAHGKRFKLASVNWYGAEGQDFVPSGLDCQPVAMIAKEIRGMGFNSVRLPWSNQLLEDNGLPLVSPARVAANLQFANQDPLVVFKAVVKALTDEGLVVILDDHLSTAGWCCSRGDSNGLWMNGAWSQQGEDQWVADWSRMASMFQGEPGVVGADLRNEPRADCVDGQIPTWDGAGSKIPNDQEIVSLESGGHCKKTLAPYSWRNAAERAGNAVRAANPNLLVMIEGVEGGTDLQGAYSHPIRLNGDTPRDGHLVYSPHNYSFEGTPPDFFNQSGAAAYKALYSSLGKDWGFLLSHGRAYTAPVWVGEFGTCNNSATNCVDGGNPWVGANKPCSKQQDDHAPGTAPPGGQTPARTNGFWLRAFACYLEQGDIDWAYWAINGTQELGPSYDDEHGNVTGWHTPLDPEGYGLLNSTWSAVASDLLLAAVRQLQSPTEFPGIVPVVPSRVRLQAGALKLSLKNHGVGPASVTVLLQVPVARASAARDRHHPLRRLVLARKRLRIGARSTRKLSLRLSRRAKTELRRHHERAVVAITITDSARQTVTRTIALHAR